MRSEYSVFDRNGYSYKVQGHMLGVGRRFGDFTYADAHLLRRDQPLHPDAIQRDSGDSATLRCYELSASTALKLRWDRFRDRSGADLSYVGNSRLLSVSIDTLF